MSDKTNASALVIGGSIAGLLAARVLRDVFDQVVVIERDRFPDGTGPRRGVPQARFIHVLLARGQALLEDWFPGLDAELEAAGAPRFDWTGDIVWHSAGRWGQRFHSGLAGRNASRDLLEGVLRRRLAADARIRFITGVEVTGLLAEPGDRRVTGVKVHLRAAESNGRPDTPDGGVLANLVVDASGRSSQAPGWLAALGYPPVEETFVNGFLGYATRWYETPPGYDPGWTILMMRSQAPHNPRGVVISRVEGGRWIFGLSGSNRDYPPTDEAGFLAFANSLPDPAAAAFLQVARPVSPIYGYRRTENRLRHYERMQAWPEGFLALGDAVCAFNPVYGQGMTAAALGAAELATGLRAAGGNAAGLGRRYQQRLARAVAVPWMMATGEDYRWPATEGGRRGPLTRLMHRYMDQIMELAIEQPAVQLVFVKVAQLLRPPADFFRPEVLARVLGRIIQRRGEEPKMQSNDYHFITDWRIESTLEEINAILNDATGLPRWWPAVYLAVEELEPGDSQGVGRVVKLYTKGWLPYTLRWQFRVSESKAPHGFTLEAWGDFVGRGIWTFEQDGNFVNVRYDWKIRADKPLLRNFSFIMKPVFSANHRWAMRKGEESLKLELARRHAPTPADRARVPAPPGPTSASPVLALLAVAGLLGLGLRRRRRASNAAAIASKAE